MTPAFRTKSGSATIYAGNCITSLQQLPAGSVQCCITSPPYWGLRDYGHDGQHGLEKTPDEYVETMVAVFREVRRVLRDDGTCWLNLGDSYNAYNGGAGPSSSLSAGAQTMERPALASGYGLRFKGLKPKDLVGIPWRVAFALQADGWWLRQDIIWSKPNPMPESVQDRCTKSHEYIFLLTKSARYYYDAEAVKEAGTLQECGNTSPTKAAKTGDERHRTAANLHKIGAASTRNRRSVWTVSTKPYSGAHFATYPPDLIEPCLFAGTSERGRCKECGAAWERVVEKTERVQVANGKSGSQKGRKIAGQYGSTSLLVDGCHASTKTIGWQPTCQCNAGEPVPCIVLDPYNGSGTTGAVAVQHGRHYLGCELNPEYIELAAKRIGDAEKRWGTPLFEGASR